MVTVALGLGKTITDGDHVWSYSPHRATAPPPFKSTGELLKFTQNSFWAVNVGDPPPPDPARENSCLVRCGLGDAEADGTLTFLASTWDPASDQLRAGLGGNGPRAVTFAPILESRSIPFTPVMERLLELSCNVLNGEAEIEFAVNLDPEDALPMEIGFVQVRPMLTPGERTPGRGNRTRWRRRPGVVGQLPGSGGAGRSDRRGLPAAAALRPRIDADDGLGTGCRQSRSR